MVAAYGIDPVLFMLAAQVFGIKESELDVAGGLMGRGVELTEAEFVSLPIPANAELVIEGLLHPGDMEDEGPLGEFTGYYGRERAPQPVIEVKAVHHRRSPILTAALMAKYPSCEIGAYYAIMRSARILDDLDRIGVSGVLGAYAHPAAASGWGMVVVSMQQQYAGHAAQVLALTAQCPAAAYYTKWIIAVDEDVDPTDFNDVMWALVDALQSGRRSRHPAQHLVDRPRSEPVSAGAAALRIEGADQRLQAAQAHQAIPAGDAVAAERVRARGRTLGRAWLRGIAAEADGVSQGVSVLQVSVKPLRQLAAIGAAATVSGISGAATYRSAGRDDHDEAVCASSGRRRNPDGSGCQHRIREMRDRASIASRQYPA